MYSLDINFLNDRLERPVEKEVRRRSSGRQTSFPLYAGLIAGVALPALMLGFWGFLKYQNQQLNERLTSVDSDLAEINQLQARVTQLNEEAGQVEAENQALATVFDQIKPWSAILYDVRTSTPANVQIGNIEQLAPDETTVQSAAQPAAAAPEEGAAAAAPAGAATDGVRISGLARSFDDVNDFVLTLQQSPFLIKEETRLVKAELIDNPTQIEFSSVEGQSTQLEASLPEVVEYSIETRLTNLSASELLPELERNLALGLTARIQALRDRGVIQP